jgi:hypothetical protein
LAQMIHYQDDAFTIRLLVKSLKDCFMLDIDPEIFLDRAVGDILFIDSSLNTLAGSLKTNEHLIDREERFRDLFSTERVYIDFLDSIIQDRSVFTEYLRPFAGKFTLILESHKKTLKDLGGILDSYLPDQGKSSDLVSQDEMNELLREENTDPSQ